MKINFDRKWGVLFSIGAGTFMTALDTSVVNTVLPVINQDYHTSIATVEWVVIIYLLSVSGLLPIFGRLGDIKGHKTIYISGFFLFILSSLFCTYSPTVHWLILSRAFQAIGAAMLSANSPAILTKSFPNNQRGQALGLQATMTYLGLTVGPSLGGWLTDQYSWRSVFLINIPVGIFALALSVFFIRKELPGKVHEGFDFGGAIFFSGGLISLLLGLNQGHNWGWLSPITLFFIALSIIAGWYFLHHEKNTQYPLLDLSLFTSKKFSLSITSAVVNYICVYGSIFLMPFYLIQGLALSPSQAGLYMTIQPIVMAIVAPISGTLSDKVGTRIPTTTGMGFMALGLYLLSRIESTTSPVYLLVSLAVLGFGIGVFISPNNSALMGSAPATRQGIAAGLLATARNVGMVLGIGIAGAIFTTIIAKHTTQTSGLYIAVQTSYLVTAILALAGMVINYISVESVYNQDKG
jgi:EmrB/QacA subfamily drug resistance transporter